MLVLIPIETNRKAIINTDCILAVVDDHTPDGCPITSIHYQTNSGEAFHLTTIANSEQIAALIVFEAETQRRKKR